MSWNTDSEQGSRAHLTLDLRQHPGQDSASSSWDGLGAPVRAQGPGVLYHRRILTNRAEPMWSEYRMHSVPILEIVFFCFVKYVNEVLVSSPKGGT